MIGVNGKNSDFVYRANPNYRGRFTTQINLGVIAAGKGLDDGNLALLLTYWQQGITFVADFFKQQTVAIIRCITLSVTIISDTISSRKIVSKIGQRSKKVSNESHQK